MNAIAKIEADVPVYDMAPRSKWVVGGTEYIYEERLAGGYKVARTDDMKIVEVFTHAHLHHLIQADEIRIDEGFFTSVKANLRLMGGKKTFNDVTDAQANKVLKKIKWCDAYLKLEAHDRSVKRSDAKLAIAIARIAAEFKAERDAADARRRAEHGLKKKRGGSKQDGELSDPSPFQLRRWVAKYVKGGLDKDALVDQYNGPGRKRLTLCSESYELHAKAANEYASSTRPTKAQQFLKLEGELDKADAVRAEAGRRTRRSTSRSSIASFSSASSTCITTTRTRALRARRRTTACAA